MTVGNYWLFFSAREKYLKCGKQYFHIFTVALFVIEEINKCNLINIPPVRFLCSIDMGKVKKGSTI